MSPRRSSFKHKKGKHQPMNGCSLAEQRSAGGVTWARPKSNFDVASSPQLSDSAANDTRSTEETP